MTFTTLLIYVLAAFGVAIILALIILGVVLCKITKEDKKKIKFREGGL